MTNHIQRLPVPQHDHYAELRWCALLGGESEIIGPFRTAHERDAAVRAHQAGYPGSHAPSSRRFAVERDYPEAARAAREGRDMNSDEQRTDRARRLERHGL